MWPDRVSNPGPLTYESGSVPTGLHSPAVALAGHQSRYITSSQIVKLSWQHFEAAILY